MPLLVSDSTRTSSLISGGVCFILFYPVHSFAILVLFAPYFLRFPWFICFILISTFVRHVEEKYISQNITIAYIVYGQPFYMTDAQ